MNKNLLVVFIVSQLLIGSALASENSWTFAGWQGGGMYPNIIADPVNQGRIFVTSDVDGLWRSDNNGDQWYFAGEGLPNFIVAVLAIAPSNTNILYAGLATGMARSDDGGMTWRDLPSTKNNISFLKPKSYRSIWISPTNPDIVYAGNQKGEVYSSKDGGSTWKMIGDTAALFGPKIPITAIQVTGDESKVFAASYKGLKVLDQTTNIWKAVKVDAPCLDVFYEYPAQRLLAACKDKLWMSLDAGENLTASAAIPQVTVSRVAVDTSGENKKIAVTWEKDWKGGMYITSDNGQTWVNAKKNLQHDQQSNPTREWTQGWARPNGIAISPFNSAVLFLTDSWGIWRSDDAGATWQEKIKGAPNTSGSDLVLDQEGNIYVATMDQGVLVSNDQGATYQAVLPNKANIEGVSGHAWRVHKFIDGRLLVSAFPWTTQRNLTFLYSPEGQLTIAGNGLPQINPIVNTMWGTGYGRAMAVDPQTPDRVYLGIDGDDGGGLFISDDGGGNWVRSTGQPGSLRIYNGLVVDPVSPNILYWGSCGKKGGVFQSLDKGKTWKRVLSASECIFDLAISSEGDVYAGGTKNGAVIYGSFDQGKTWEQLKSFPAGSACDGIALNPENRDQVLVGTIGWSGDTGGKIFMSNNRGKAWEDITQGLPHNSGPAAMAIDGKKNILYVLLYAGSVYKRSLEAL